MVGIVGRCVVDGNLGSKAEREEVFCLGRQIVLLHVASLAMESVFWVSSYVEKLSFHLIPRDFCLFI
jgi:hypothetical protein